jgi:hypothetical protein
MQYFGEQYPVLRTNNIFLMKNWVPKCIIGDPNDNPFWRTSPLGYVICVKLSMLFQPTFLLLID